MKILAKLFKKPTVFQGFWHGPALGPVRMACLASFVKQGHHFDLYTYGPVEVPAGIRIKDAAEIIPLNEVFYYQNPFTQSKDIGPFSDLFRFKLLSERGGWWSDVDAFCMSDDIPVVERAWAQELPELKPHAVGTSQIAFARNDSLVTELYNKCLAISKTDYPSRECLGPFLISDTIAEHGLPKNCFGTTATFYPVRWIEMYKLWLPEYLEEMHERMENTCFLPVYASFPQYIGLDLGWFPPKGSYMGELCEKYLGRMPENRRYSPDAIIEGTRKFFLDNMDWAPNELKAISGHESLRHLKFGCELQHFQ